MSHDAPPDPFGPPADLTGRDRELDVLRRFLDGAGRSADTSLVLRAGPGAGRTELLRAGCRYAARDGFLVLSAQGSELETGIGYAGLQQLLWPVWSGVECAAGEGATALGVALGIVPGDPPPVDRIAEATAGFLVALARDRPVLVAVDDAERLDRPSLRALRRIVTRGLTAGARVAFLSTSAVYDVDVADRAHTVVLDVQPLSVDAAGALLDGAFPDLAPARRAAVLGAAHGNPLALLELAGAGTGSVPSEAFPAPLPHLLVEVFAGPLAALDASACRLVLLAALDRGGPTVAAPLLSAGEDVVGRFRDPGPASVVYWEDGRGVRFRHPLTARAVVQQAARADVRAAHRALGRYHAPDPAAVETAAWHLAEAATSPDETVACLLERAADAVLGRGDAPAAVAPLLRAAALSETAADRTRRTSRAALITSQVTGDLAATEEMLAAARADDPGFRTSLAAATATASTLLLGNCDVDTAYRLLITSIDSHPDRDAGDDEILVDALATLHAVCWYAGRSELWAPQRRAVERLRPAVPPPLRLCTYLGPDPTRAGPDVRAELIEQISVLGSYRDPLAVIAIAIAACHVDEIGACRSELARIAGDRLRGGALLPAINARYLMALDDLVRGDWASCRALLTEGIDLAERHDHPMLAWTGQCHLARLAAAEGKDDELADRLARLEQWALPRGLESVTMHVEYASALAASGRGDFRAAYRHAELLSPPGTFAPFVSMAPQVSFELVEAAVRTGQQDAALRHAAALDEAGAATWSSRWRLVAASCTALADDAGPSVERLRAVLAEAGSARWPFDRARGRLVVGAHLRRHNQVAESRSYLTAAASAFTELGASGWAGRAEEELAATAAVRRRTEGSGFDALSAQERRVVELAAEGLRTKQIAEQLGISPRTVSNHLYRAFPKLGVRSRAGLRRVLGT